MTTTIQKWGNSLGVRIPKALAEEAGIADGDAVTVTENNGKITVERKQKKKLTYIPADLSKLLKGYNKKIRHPEFDWGPPVGREIW
jgi:antitoxin MazE